MDTPTPNDHEVNKVILKSYVLAALGGIAANPNVTTMQDHEVASIALRLGSATYSKMEHCQPLTDAWVMVERLEAELEKQILVAATATKEAEQRNQFIIELESEITRLQNLIRTQTRRREIDLFNLDLIPEMFAALLAPEAKDEDRQKEQERILNTFLTALQKNDEIFLPVLNKALGTLQGVMPNGETTRELEQFLKAREAALGE